MNVNELPYPSHQNREWPWLGSDEFEECSSELVFKNIRYPRISIVTINYNHGLYLEQAIRSVLLQGYPNLEYIIIDGGSSDGSLEIIHRYKKWLSYWISEKDDGPPYAANKGLSRCSGDIIGWLSSTDYLLPGILNELAVEWSKSGNSLYYGRSQLISNQGHILADDVLIPQKKCSWKDLLKGARFPMNVVFFPSVFVKEGARLNEKMINCCDLEFCLRILERYPARYIDRHLATFRVHPQQRSGGSPLKSGDFLKREDVKILKNYLRRKDLSYFKKIYLISTLGVVLIDYCAELYEQGKKIKAYGLLLICYLINWENYGKRALNFFKNPRHFLKKVFFNLNKFK